MKPFVNLIPAFDDNYIFSIRDGEAAKTSEAATNFVALVDPGESAPCLEYLKKNNLRLSHILITHHHDDHIDGIQVLKAHFPEVQIYAPEKNRYQIPEISTLVVDGDHVAFRHFNFQVIELPGHTLGHVAFYEPRLGWLFSGDVLFGLGCGRLFEGTPQLMFESLDRLKRLPANTQIFCTHELTERNLLFVEDLIQHNEMPKSFEQKSYGLYKEKLQSLRGRAMPSVPLVLKEELGLNPFLLSQNVDEWAKIRQWRNEFKIRP